MSDTEPTEPIKPWNDWTGNRDRPDPRWADQLLDRHTPEQLAGFTDRIAGYATADLLDTHRHLDAARQFYGDDERGGLAAQYFGAVDHELTSRQPQPGGTQ